MTPPIVKGVAKSAQQIAQQAAKQAITEPFEVAKAGAKQVSGVEVSTQAAPQKPPQTPQTPQASESQIKALNEKDESISTSRYQSLQKEIQVIGQRRKDQDLQRRQIEEVQRQEAQKSQGLIEPSAKRSRNPLKGMAKKLSDLGKRAEIRMPPSG